MTSTSTAGLKSTKRTGENTEAFERYVSEVSAAFELAVSRVPERRFHYDIAGEVVCLRFAGDALASRLTRALAHLVTGASAAPSLTILCWDSTSTGTQMPPPPWQPTAYGPRGHIIGFNDAEMRTLYQPGVDILHMLSSTRRLGIYWVQRPEVVPWWESSFPMRGILHWWCRSRPLQLVHAGAVGTKNGGVLLTGKSGSGKSTSAVACLDSPLEYAGDDYVVIASGPQPFVHSLYGTAKLVPESIDLLPHLRGLRDKMSNPESLATEKALYYLHELHPEKLCRGFPVRAIFLPRVTGERDTVLRMASGRDAMLALAPTTLKHLEGDANLALAKMGKLAASVPSHWLDVGTDLAQIPATIMAFLERAHV